MPKSDKKFEDYFKIIKHKLPYWDELPEIDLYMDQVTTLLNSKFSDFKRDEEDKLLTKTMINNYTKFKLLPPPEKKKYSRDHIVALAMIYFMKNVISINDIGTITAPAIEEFFHNEENSLQNLFDSLLKGIDKINDANELKILSTNYTQFILTSSF